jgi:hypothetical protein
MKLNFVKFWENNVYITWRPTYILQLHLAQTFLEREKLQTELVENV